MDGLFIALPGLFLQLLILLYNLLELPLLHAKSGWLEVIVILPHILSVVAAVLVALTTLNTDST